uniref:Uncharacterized protein n=1 Tax=Cyprinus carpio TaxID=7962 RepID=A0A8C2F0K2_CYPCA
MGAADSKSRSVSYGLDEQDNVTVIHGVKLSGDVLQRMRESGPSSSSSSSSSSPGAESAKPAPGTLFEREQALVQEELARISRREREMAGDDMNPAALRETAKTRQELDKTHNLARQLKKKEDELKHLEQFYKEQLQLMEKKVCDTLPHEPLLDLKPEFDSFMNLFSLESRTQTLSEEKNMDYKNIEN